MNYGDIIKRAWRMTWRFKALWVLGIFAGVSGCQGGGSGGNYNNSSWNTGSQDFRGLGSDFGQFSRFVEQSIPLIIAVIFLLFLLAIVFSVIGIAARGGLVSGASAYEDGRRLRLGELWGAGFGRFWTLVGLDILLKLPIFALALVVLVAVFAPLFGTIAGGGEPGFGVVAPICGGLAIGLPLLLVISFILGVMYLVALRYVMLGGQGAIEAAGNSWRFFRARFKDTLVLWLINAGLNIAASFAIAIPIIVVSIGVAIPIAATGVARQWGALAGLVAVLAVIIWVIAILYNGIWGTFTSALWTCFFRDVTGMTVAAMPSPAEQPGMQPAYPAQAAYPAAPPAPPASPTADYPPAPPQPPAPLSPPMAEDPFAPPAPEPPVAPEPPAPPASPTDG